MTFKELHEDVDQIFSRLEETSMIWFDDDVDRVAFEEKVVKIFQEQFIDRLKDSILNTVDTMMWGKEKHPVRINYRKPTVYRPSLESQFTFAYKGTSHSGAEQIADDILSYAEGMGFITINQVRCCFYDYTPNTDNGDKKGWTYDMLKDGGIKIQPDSTNSWILILPKPILKPDRFKEVIENA